MTLYGGDRIVDHGGQRTKGRIGDPSFWESKLHA